MANLLSTTDSEGMDGTAAPVAHNSDNQGKTFVLDGQLLGDREHFVRIYENDAELVSLVTDYVGETAAAGDAALIIVTPEHRQQIERLLAERGIHIPTLERQKRYIALDASETLSHLMDGENVDGTRFQQFMGTMLKEMLSRQAKVRAFGEMVALLWAGGNRKGAWELERLWNKLGKQYAFTLFCGYPVQAFNPADPSPSMADICQCHSHILGKEDWISRVRGQDSEIEKLHHKNAGLQTEIARRLKAESELSDFLENALEGIHKVGADGKIIWANKAELDLLGYQEHEYVGRHISEFHVNGDAIGQILCRLLKGENLLNEPAQLRCKDGSVKDVLIHSNAFFDNGQFVHSRCFSRDVTEIKKADRDRAMLASIVESSQDAIISKTLDGVIRSWNAGAEHTFGYTAAEAVGRHITLIIPPERADEEKNIIDRIKHGERVEHFETVRRAKDGRLLDISLTVSPLKDSRGNLVGASKSARDITERKRIETQLAESQARLQRDFTAIQKLQATSSTLLQQSDSNALYKRILDAAVDIMGSDFGSMQVLDEERNALRLLAFRGFEPEFGDAFKYVFPETRTSCSMARRIGGRAIINDMLTCDFVVEVPAAAEAHRQAGIRSAQSTPLLSRSGKLVGMITTHWRRTHTPPESDLRLLDLLARQAADLLDRTQAEERLRESEERYRQLLGLLPVGVYACDAPSGELTYWNAHATVLWGREPKLGETVDKFCGSHKLLAPDGKEIPADQSPMAAALRDGRELRNVEVVIERPDGSRISALVNIAPIHDGNGKMTGALTVFQDMSALKQAEQQLKESDRRKDEFLATLAHELRNPLAPIRNGLQILKMGDKKDTVSTRVHGMMERQITHLVRLVDDLLEISRISRGKIELRKERLELSSVLQVALETSRPVIEAAGHTLTVEFADAPLVLDGDSVRLSQVFSNLLNNAAKYTARGGKIIVFSRCDSNEAIVTVSDTGIGIPRDMLSQVFEMFVQVDNPFRRTKEGLGIGLSLVRSLVTMHGGRVHADSQGPGLGSQFTVRLPIAALVDGGAKRDAVPVIKLDSRADRVLVVDDNQDSAESLGMVLQCIGAEVKVAYDARSALEMIKAFRPTTILMDIGMPGMDGCEAAQAIRGDPQNANIFLVALTGWGQERDRQRSHAAGFDHHLVKPVELNAVKELLAARSRRSYAAPL